MVAHMGRRVLDQQRHCICTDASRSLSATGDFIVLELISTKCLSALFYELEACPLRKADISSLDFVVNRFL